jgi:hypothetical protein
LISGNFIGVVDIAELEEYEMTIRTGRYRHYKGQDYFVLGVARHSENQEEVVV